MVPRDHILKNNNLGESEVFCQLVSKLPYRTGRRINSIFWGGSYSDLRLFDKDLGLYIDFMKNGQMYSGGGVYNEAGELQYTIIKGIEHISLQAETFGKIFKRNSVKEWKSNETPEY